MTKKAREYTEVELELDADVWSVLDEIAERTNFTRDTIIQSMLVMYVIDSTRKSDNDNVGTSETTEEGTASSGN